jgi:hypothetical protein
VKNTQKNGNPSQPVKPHKESKHEVLQFPLLQGIFRKIPHRVFFEFLLLIILLIVALKLPGLKPTLPKSLKKQLMLVETARQPAADTPVQNIPTGAKEETKASAPIISAAWITPSQPTINDTLHVTVNPTESNMEGLTYSYQWKVNGQDVLNATGDTFPDLHLKRRDQVSILITPYRDGIQGPSYESPFVVVHSRPMTLEMKMLAPAKLGQAIEMQLIATHPDGAQITYFLDTPYLEGMKINEKTGLITWIPANVVSGTYYFGAAVKDEDGNKLTKTFEFHLDLGMALTK